MFNKYSNKTTEQVNFVGISIKKISSFRVNRAIDVKSKETGLVTYTWRYFIAHLIPDLSWHDWISYKVYIPLQYLPV